MKMLVLLLALISTSAFAQKLDIEFVVLSPNQIHNIIGDFPARGSAAEAQDFNTMLKIQQLRTVQHCQAALRDDKHDLGTMFGGILSPAEIQKLSSSFSKAYASLGINIYMAKKMYKRPRPYDANPMIKPCIGKEDSYAYPSGHSMTVRAYARILAALFPQRAQALLKRSNEYAWNRVVGGVHHPTDVKAAFALADFLADEMLKVDVNRQLIAQ